MEEGKKKKSKLAKAIKAKAIAVLLKVLVVILVLVLLGGIFYAVVDAIIGFIKDIVGGIQNIADFFDNLPKWVEEKWVVFKSKLTEWLKGGFSEEQFEIYRTDPVIVIKDDQVKEVLAELDAQIDREAAGLDNVMVKKMLLAYYRGLYLDDTKILIQITQEDLQMDKRQWLNLFAADLGEGNDLLDVLLPDPAGDLIQIITGDYPWVLKDEGKEYLKQHHGDSISPFEIVEGNPEALMGDDKELYLQTTGMLQIFVDGTDTDKCDGCTKDANRENCKYTLDDNDKTVCYYKIKYYSDTPVKDKEESPFTKLYNHYLESFYENGREAAYTEAVKEYLTKCYTYVEGGIKMYSHRQVVYTEKTWEYGNETDAANKKNWFEKIFDDSTETRKRKLTPTTTYPIVSEIIEFKDKVAPYANSVEFMSDLMEITGSKEFVNAFIETVGEKNYIKMRLYALETTEEKTEAETKDRTTSVKGTKSYYAKVVAKNKKGYDWDSWNTQGIDKIKANTEVIDNSTVGVSIENPEKNMQYRVWLYDQNNKFIKEGHVYGDGWNYDSSDEVCKFTVQPMEYTFKDTSTIEETTITTTESLNYDIGITEIKTWYGEKKLTNTINLDMITTIEHHETKKDENGNTIKDALGRPQIAKYEGENGNREPIKGARETTTITVDSVQDKNLEQIFSALWEKTVLYNLPVQEKDRTYIWTREEDENKNIIQKQTETIGEDTRTTIIDDTAVFEYADKEIKIQKNIFDTKLPVMLPYSDELLSDVAKNALNQKSDGEKLKIYSKDYQHTLAECLNLQYNWAIRKGSKPDYNEYDNIGNMSATDTNINYVAMNVIYKQSLIAGELSGLEKGDSSNYYTFLGLLSNESGKYELGASFKPVTNNSSNSGKLVGYNDLYNSTTYVANLLVNGAEMLDTLLRSHHSKGGTNLEEIANAMKEALKIYSTGNYSVTDPNDMNIYEEDSYIDANGEKVGVSAGISGGILAGKTIVNTEQMLR